MSTWKAIMFDLDNTLFSHENAFKKAISECFHIYQQHYVPKENQKNERQFFPIFKHYSDYYWGKFESGESTGDEYRRDRFNETMKELELPFSNEIADMFHKQYYQIVDEYSVPFEGVHEFLQTINDFQLKTAVVTNGTKDTQYKKIEKIGVNKWIQPDQIYVSEEVGFAKPNKEIFRLVEKEQKLSSKDILFIGDSWKHDVVGALNAGWEAIFLNTRQEKRTSEHKPLKEYDNFMEMKNSLTDMLREGRSS
ncbi:HAD family hydrolase [Salipaludibacillus daqingensis]|uniref:HAD family hydrolase n=1 Tax=Salipaludibacillus daqingensis TaxID=3041001 RepID=UPI002475186B|nr:HAD-IA family hydrolase [Salipaludibacillus daqingensis]